MVITDIINGRGGVGKTSTTRAMVSGIDRFGEFLEKYKNVLVSSPAEVREYKALGIDFDPSGNLTRFVGLNEKESPAIYHVIEGKIDIFDAIQETKQGDYIAGNATLNKIDGMFRDDNYLDGVQLLKELVKPLATKYTHIIIDNNPKIGGMVSMQTLYASTNLIAPLEADEGGLMGLDTLRAAIKKIHACGNPDLVIDGILITRHEANTINAKEFEEGLEDWRRVLNTKVYQTPIRKGKSVKDSAKGRISVYDFKMESGRENFPAQDYFNVVNEYLKTGGK